MWATVSQSYVLLGTSKWPTFETHFIMKFDFLCAHRSWNRRLLKTIFFTTIVRTKEEKEEKVGKGIQPKKKKKKEKLKEKSLEWVADNLFSAWSHLPLIQVCFLGNRFDVLLCLQYILQNDWEVISVSQLGPKYWSDKTDLFPLQNDSTRERAWSHQSRGTEDSSFPRKECQGIKLNPK